MNILIVGCSKTGARLANELDDYGFDVSVVDADAHSFIGLKPTFSGLSVCGEVTDIDVLKNAGAENAETAIVVTNLDNVNVMVAQTLAVEFGIENTFVRILDPSREAVFRKFGLRTVCPTRVETDILLDLVTEDAEELNSISIGGISIRFFMEKADKKEIGHELADIVTKRTEMLFALRRKSGLLILADQESTVIEEGDMLVYAKI